MLIKALCDYYDILSEKGSVLPAGYSKVNVHYLISLTEDGQIDEIVDCQKTEQVPSGKKMKEKKVPVEMIMPREPKKTIIYANIAEHRPLYIFGLKLEKGELSTDDGTDKARKSHKDFVEKNLKFMENIHSPVVEAYKKFLASWIPENEEENKWLLGLGKDYQKSNFAFCLSGNPDCLLHEDPELKIKWEREYINKGKMGKEKTAQCAITGKQEVIARTHDVAIKGIYGGQATGNILISYKNPSETSYGNIQSYNSNISEKAMRKYTEALNYLLSSSKHKAVLDDMTIVFWAMSSQEAHEDLFMKLLLGKQDQLDAIQTDDMLRELLKDAKDARITEERIQSLNMIDPKVDFYMLGLKPNSSRLSVKFMIKKKYADVLWNIARFQRDLQVSEVFHSVALWQIKKEMISPNSKNDNVNPALMSRVLESIIYGKAYPQSLLETVIRRVKIDEGSEKINSVRAGVIKACINRNQVKEELKLSLDKTNQSQAYLCGRLFAVLEKLQQDASNNSLNRTIKDAYFASASAKPALVFPKLIRLAQNHLNKVKYPVYYNKLIGEIMNGLNGEFPETFRLMDQGRFDIGYYQQNQDLWKKADKSEETEVK